MAEVVGALLSGFVSVLFDRMATQEVLNFFQGKKVLASLLEKLKITMLSANKLFHDAEEKQLTDENVKKWLDELKDVLYRADHVMDKINTKALQRKIEKGDQSGSKPRKFFMSKLERTVKSEIEKILQTLDLLLRQKDGLGLREGVHQNRPQKLPVPLADACNVYGRDDEKEAIIKLLLSDPDGGCKISVIPIVGMGGIGKTTLAQLIYNDSMVHDHFALKVWVTVSEQFNVLEITRAILEKATGREYKTEDLHVLQTELKKEIIGKRFLFVHDDVWNENYDLWDALRSPFNFGADGSKIIVTTRSEIVASKMGNVRAYHLQMISDDDCWKLFADHVSDNIDFWVNLEWREIAKEIVKKCKGLPLAVKSVAGVLRCLSSLEEWKGILESDIWELQFQENKNNNILPALWLSYRFLPSQLKRCFAYCAIFPKDYEFSKEDQETLLLLWMAEGLVQPSGAKRMEDVGKDYLDGLISRSLFQRSSDMYGNPILLMHDLVHDLATHISGEFCFVLDGHNYLDDITSKTRHVSCRKNSKDMTKLNGLFKTKCLSTLLALSLSYVYVDYSILTDASVTKLLLNVGECLKVLCLSQSCVTKLPSSIGDLKQLKYLDLSYTKVKKLPSQICTLYNLQTLLLSGCENLTQLPTNMCKLINLRHLMICGTALKEMPPHMCKLRNLQTLSDFVLSANGGSKIKELGELQFLHGSLCISGLENVVDVRGVSEANLKNKKHLTELFLRWEFGRLPDDSMKEAEVLNALEPHRKLKNLEIEGYGGTIFPDWVAHQSFSDMTEVSLQKCKNCCLLPPLGQLPSLRELKIRSMYGLESIGDEFCGTSLNKPFPSLEWLSIDCMPSLEKWSFTGADQEREIFPRLKNIYLQFCKKLKVGLPAGRFPALETIAIFDCEEMVSVLPTSSEVEIDYAFPSLRSIFVSSCPKLESFSGMGIPFNLKTLRIWCCPKLFENRMNWDLQRHSSLQSLALDGREFEEAVDSFPEEGLFPSTLTSLCILGFINLKALNGKGFQHLTSLQRLGIFNCEQLESLPEEGLPLSLTCLTIDGSPLLEERCQRGTGEDWPKIQHISKIQINWIEI